MADSSRNTTIAAWVVGIVIVLAAIAWYAGWFGGTKPVQTSEPAPPATTQPAQPSTAEQPAAPATPAPAPSTGTGTGTGTTTQQ